MVITFPKTSPAASGHMFWKSCFYSTPIFKTDLLQSIFFFILSQFLSQDITVSLSVCQKLTVPVLLEVDSLSLTSFSLLLFVGDVIPKILSSSLRILESFY